MSLPPRVVRLVPAVLALALVAAACTVEVTVHTLTVEQAQEDGFLQNGDEPYVAVIKWRVIPGTAGSASSEFIGNLDELATGADDGDVLSIPSSMGAVSFANVQSSSAGALLQGKLPELTGTVMVAMESDLTSWGTVNSLMNDVEAALLTELQNQIEPLTIVDLTNPAVVSAALATAAANVEAAVTPGVLDSILLWLGSLGNPDDLIGIGFTVWIAAYGTLGTFIESSLLGALPAGATGGVWSSDLDPIDTSVTFSGDGARYRVDITADAS
jgi:hypothetical protein